MSDFLKHHALKTTSMTPWKPERLERSISLQKLACSIAVKWLALVKDFEGTCFEEGPWDGSRYGCVGFLVFECVAAWECSAAQLRRILTW